MSNATPDINPEQAAREMRRWLPRGPYPGAPPTGTALQQRMRRGTAPPAYHISGGPRGSTGFVRAEVKAWCLELYPPQIKHEMRVVEAMRAMVALPDDMLTESDVEVRMALENCLGEEGDESSAPAPLPRIRKALAVLEAVEQLARSARFDYDDEIGKHISDALEEILGEEGES